MISFFRKLVQPLAPAKPKCLSEKKQMEAPIPTQTVEDSPTLPHSIAEFEPIHEFTNPITPSGCPELTHSPISSPQSTIYPTRRSAGNRPFSLPMLHLNSTSPLPSCHIKSSPWLRGGLCSNRSQTFPEVNRFEPLLKHFRIVGPLHHAAPTSVVYNVVKLSTLQLNTARLFKKITSYESDADYRRRLRNEIMVATRLEHFNIMKLYDVCTHSDLHFVITDGGFYDGYGLLGKQLPECESHALIWDLLEGLNYLHSVGIAHLDLKLENLAIHYEGTLKI
ncbi:hypothetical protein L0F63_002874, partial [Massospora cicadina]